MDIKGFLLWLGVIVAIAGGIAQGNRYFPDEVCFGFYVVAAVVFLAGCAVKSQPKK